MDDDLKVIIMDADHLPMEQRTALAAILKRGRTVVELRNELALGRLKDATALLQELLRKGLVEIATGKGRDAVYGLHPHLLSRLRAGVGAAFWRPDDPVNAQDTP